MVFLTDILYTYFLRAVRDDRPMIASLWSVAVTFTASVAVIEYTQDNKVIFASLLGAFLGTYVGMKYRKD